MLECMHSKDETLQPLSCYRRTATLSSSVVPKLGVMAPQGAMGLLPGSHGRILGKYIFQGLILKYGPFGIFYPLKCNILEY